MLTILKSHNFWVATLLSALFWAVAPYIPRPYVFDIVNSFSISTLLGVLVMYYASVAKKTGTWLWVFHNNLSGAHYFVIGILGLCVYIIFRHTYTGVWRWFGQPQWMINNLVLAFAVYCTGVIGVMHLLSRDIEEGKIPNENWRWVGIFIALGMAFAGVSIMIFDPLTEVASPMLR